MDTRTASCAWPGVRLGTVRIACAALLATMLAGCGGGGGEDGIGPVWIETSIAAADLDGDGLQDVVTVSSYSQSYSVKDGVLSVHLQTPGFAFAAPENIDVGNYPWLVRIADVDGDGAPDIAVLDVDPQGAPQDSIVYLLLQDRSRRGHFLPPQAIAQTSWCYDLLLADVNGDGAPDLVLASTLAGGNGALVAYQRLGERGSFDPPVEIALPGRATYVAAGDLDGDGLLDLAFYASTSDFPTGSAMLVYGLPGGGFGPAVVMAPQTGVNAKLVAIADVDGNGLPDVVQAFTPSLTPYQSHLTVLLQTSVEVFQAPVDTSLAGVQGLDGFAVGNLNGDGLPDVAATGFYPTGSPTTVQSRANVLMAAGNGQFGLAASYPMPVAMSRITAADLNGDGLNDLVLLGEDNRAFVMLQSSGSPGTFLPAVEL
ncbi:MAG: VCBS repeat-containing protein [Betaproteobacteria bacterium]|nr:VCBS repeat-containing protein [Betaproteobacteria bacterium]